MLQLGLDNCRQSCNHSILDHGSNGFMDICFCIICTSFHKAFHSLARRSVHFPFHITHDVEQACSLFVNRSFKIYKSSAA